MNKKDEKEHLTEIPYTIEEDSPVCKTECPYKIFSKGYTAKVGSVYCDEKCVHRRGNDKINKIVLCAHPLKKEEKEEEKEAPKQEAPLGKICIFPITQILWEEEGIKYVKVEGSKDIYAINMETNVAYRVNHSNTYTYTPPAKPLAERIKESFDKYDTQTRYTKEAHSLYDKNRSKGIELLYFAEGYIAGMKDKGDTQHD